MASLVTDDNHITTTTTTTTTRRTTTTSDNNVNTVNPLINTFNDNLSNNYNNLTQQAKKQALERIAAIVHFEMIKLDKNVHNNERVLYQLLCDQWDRESGL